MALIRTGGAPAAAFDTLTWVNQTGPSTPITLSGIKKGERIVVTTRTNSSTPHTSTRLVTSSTGLNSLTYAEGAYYQNEVICLEMLEATSDDPVISSAVNYIGIYKLV